MLEVDDTRQPICARVDSPLILPGARTQSMGPRTHAKRVKILPERCAQFGA